MPSGIQPVRQEFVPRRPPVGDKSARTPRRCVFQCSVACLHEVLGDGRAAGTGSVRDVFERRFVINQHLGL